MGNYSRDPNDELAYAIEKDYVRVRFQQGKPALDRELNLAADLADPRRLTSRYLGNGIAGRGSDFRIANVNVNSKDFELGEGRALVGGLEAVLRGPTTFQKLYPGAALPPLPFRVYLKVGEREVNSAEDAVLANGGDVTFETAIRTRVDWRIIATTAVIDSADHLLLAEVAAGGAVTDRRRLGLDLASTQDEVSKAQADLKQLTSTALKRVTLFEGDMPINPTKSVAIRAFKGVRDAALVTSVRAGYPDAKVSWRDYVTQSIEGGQMVWNRGVIVTNEHMTAGTTVTVKIFELVEH
jgi:hypothetical protein